MYCESCGSLIPDGQKFCSNCGAEAPHAPAYTYLPVNDSYLSANDSVEVDPRSFRNVSVEVPVSSIYNYTARTGMIFGIVSVVTLFILYTNIVPAVIGMIFSLKGLKKADELGGRPMCVVGIVMSSVGSVYWLIAVIAGIINLASSR